MKNWINVNDLKPPVGQVVDTKVDDRNGVRNEQPLFWRNNLWWNEDGKTYVYYTPTHWKAV